MRERHAERVHPEVVVPLRVTSGDVTGHALVVPEAREQPEARGQPLLAVQALFLHRRELGQVEPDIAEQPLELVGPSLSGAGRIGLGLVSHVSTSCGVATRVLRFPNRRVRRGTPSRPSSSSTAPSSVTMSPVAPASVTSAPPATGPARKAALASTSARHASPAITVTDAMPDSPGRPVRGSRRWCIGRPARLHARRSRVLVATAPVAKREHAGGAGRRAGRRPRSPSRAVPATPPSRAGHHRGSRARPADVGSRSRSRATRSAA